MLLAEAPLVMNALCWHPSLRSPSFSPRGVILFGVDNLL